MSMNAKFTGQQASQASETPWPGRLLVSALVLAPWLYGGLRGWAAALLGGLLTIALTVWIWDHKRRGTTWHLPTPLLLAGAFLLLQGWAMVMFRKSSAAGTPVAAAAAGATLFLGVLALAADLGRQAEWRHRVWLALAGNGVALTIFGLIQKLSGAKGILGAPDPEAETFFATFAYHGSAGSYFNLTWPLAAGLGIVAFHRTGARGARAGWLAGVALTFAALLVNTSRSALFLAGLLAFVTLAGVAWLSARGKFRRIHPARVAVVVVLVGASVYGLASMVGLERTLHRWSVFERELSSKNLRLRAQKRCVEIASRAGWFGFGPGTFHRVFAHFEPEVKGDFSGFARHAHQDYLQAVIEWGWLGAAAWAVVLAGGVIRTVRAVRRARGHWAFRDEVLTGSILLALLGVTLHALVDYPMQVPAIQLTVAVMLGLLWSSPHWPCAPKSGEHVERAD
jgi:O-antigen ligase